MIGYLKNLETVEDTEEFLDAEIQIEGETLSVNITLTPLLGKIVLREDCKKDQKKP